MRDDGPIPGSRRPLLRKPAVSLRAEWREYALVIASVVLLTAGGLLLPSRYSLSVGLVYLLAVILLSLRVGRWPMLLAGVLSAVTWEYVFLEPRFQFRLNSLEDKLLVAVYFVVALVAGQLTARIRDQARTERLHGESERLLRALLDSVSHELRTPLAVITASLETIETEPPLVREKLTAEMRTAAHRLNRLVRNLLDQTRLESGTLEPRPDWCDPRDLVNTALEGVGDMLTGRPREVAIPEDMPPVRADFMLMEHSLANLLLNVARHTPAGTPVYIAAGIEAYGGHVFFSVSDRGPGLPRAVRDNLFRKFMRGDAGRSGGLGLGLSIVHGFVAAQGGELVHRDNEGGGTIFTIYLPHSPPQPERKE